MAKLIANLGRIFQQLVFKSLRINYIEHTELYTMGWAIVLVDLVTGAVMMSRKHYADGAAYLAFAVIMGPVLAYIGRSLGRLVPPQRELVELKITLDHSSTLLLAALLRQSLLYHGEGATILAEQGAATVRAIADDIERQAATHLLANQGGTK